MCTGYLGLDKVVVAERKEIMSKSISHEKLPYAYTYKQGNPAGKKAHFSCSHCDFELLGEEVKIVAAGTDYADDEWAPCPRCGEENPVERDDEQL